MFTKRLHAAVLGLALAACSLSAAEDKADFRFVSQSDAERYLTGVFQTDSSATMYIWSTDYVFRPGNAFTLRWTVNPNNDLYPYTIFAYRVNNQTGAKSYLPGGTSTATDIFGNDASTGFQPTLLPTASKAVLIGEGGRFPAVTIPNELGMHTVVVELRDYLGGRVIKRAYWKLSVVDGNEVIPNSITTEVRLVNTKSYTLRGNTFVTGNGRLIIEPGTVIKGEPGSDPTSYLNVSRGAQLIANGTQSRPIIFTSSRPIGQRSRGDWGGIQLLGAAPTNWPTEPKAEGQVTDERVNYGGNNATSSCGSIRYVRIEFAGARFTATNELNGLAFYGCGSGTVTDHIQVHYAADDSFEWFGGTNDGKYLVSTYNADDQFDWTYGYSGRLQYLVGIHNQDPGGNGIEADNSDQGFGLRPISRPTLFNLTLIGGAKDDSSRGARLRAGTSASLNNLVLTGWVDEGLRIETTESYAEVDANRFVANGVLLWNNRGNGQTITAQTDATTLPVLQGTRGSWTNIVSANPMLRRVQFSDPDFRPMPTSPVFRAGWVQPPDDGFFDQNAYYMGALGEDNWLEEWTLILLESDLNP
ncbi:MAG: hypothetical protein SFV54_00875 [Bryobacteraceae bacterium]|nr:hypothetical protein [Bryobacteraceae bacterium]